MTIPNIFNLSESVDRFCASPPDAGEIIPHRECWAMVGLEMPDSDAPWNEAKEGELAFLSAFDKFRQQCLERHKIDLVSVRGMGYTIIDPREQTAAATRDARRAMQNKLARAERRVANVRTDHLSDAERAERTDALARLHALKQATRKKPDKAW